MTDAEPLGPDSLTWRYFGDWRGVLVALWAGSMQNLHPGIGAGVDQHSTFFTERWQRLFRSLYPIGGVVYDGPRARDTAVEVRRYHDGIGGVDSRGRRYHALDPDTFYWAHATFFVTTLLVAERFAGGLTDRQRRTLFDEHVRWYRLYGVSMRPVPRTWEDFQRYWRRMCTEVLEDNPAARGVLDVERIDRPPFLPWFPDAVWARVRGPVMRGYVWLTVGLYDPEVRDLLGYRWSARDERRHRRLGRLIAAVFDLVPFERRYQPRARSGWRRALGKTRADAPLVHTPARNLPPEEECGRPTHYSPPVT